MTETKKKELQSRMETLCVEAIRAIAKKHNLKVRRFASRLRMDGPTGYITAEPYNKGTAPYGGSEFTPGYRSLKAWDDFFAQGVLLSWDQTDYPATRGNFRATDEKEVTNVLKRLGLTAS